MRDRPAAGLGSDGREVGTGGERDEGKTAERLRAIAAVVVEMAFRLDDHPAAGGGQSADGDLVRERSRWASRWLLLCPAVRADLSFEALDDSAAGVIIERDFAETGQDAGGIRRARGSGHRQRRTRERCRSQRRLEGTAASGAAKRLLRFMMRSRIAVRS